MRAAGAASAPRQDSLKRLAAEGKFGADRVLTVRTALDVDLQRHAEGAIENALRQQGKAFRARA